MGAILSALQPRKKLTDMDTITLLKRLEECVVPDDKEQIMDYLEMVDEKMETHKEAMLFKENRGTNLLMKILRKMVDDPVVVRLILTVFDSAREYKVIIIDFIQFGGVDLLKKIKEEHEKEPFLSGFVPEFLEDVLLIGANAAMVDIVHEMCNLEMCHHCQEVLERAKFKGVYGLVEIKLPKMAERVNRVVMFMENYQNRKDVQLLALDALITYVKNCKY